MQFLREMVAHQQLLQLPAKKFLEVLNLKALTSFKACPKLLQLHANFSELTVAWIDYLLDPAEEPAEASSIGPPADPTVVDSVQTPSLLPNNVLSCYGPLVGSHLLQHFA